MKRYERAITTFIPTSFDAEPAVPVPPGGDDTWALVAVMRADGVMAVAYWQREARER